MTDTADSDEDFFPFPGGAVALQFVSFPRTSEGFKDSLRLCDELLKCCSENKCFPIDTVERLKYLENGRIWDRENWDFSKWPWSQLPRDAETHQLAAELFDTSRETIIEVAVHAGLSNCERLFGSGEARKAAWIELEVLLRQATKDSRSDFSDETKTLAHSVVVSLDPPQIVLDGAAFALTDNQALYLQELSSRPGEWMSDSEFKRRKPVVGESAKPERWRKALPAPVKNCIETDTRRGSRWMA